MLRLPLNRKMLKKLSQLGKKRGNFTNEEVKEYLGLDICIRDLQRYMRVIEMTYDYELRVWRKKKELPTVRERYINKIKRAYAEMGLEWTHGS